MMLSRDIKYYSFYPIAEWLAFFVLLYFPVSWVIGTRDTKTAHDNQRRESAFWMGFYNNILYYVFSFNIAVSEYEFDAVNMNELESLW